LQEAWLKFVVRNISKNYFVDERTGRGLLSDDYWFLEKIVRILALSHENTGSNKKCQSNLKDKKYPFEVSQLEVII